MKTTISVGQLPSSKKQGFAAPSIDIAKSSPYFFKFISLKVINGRKANLLKDPWLDSTPLEQLFPNLYNLSSKKEASMAVWLEEQCNTDLSFQRSIFDRE